MATDGAIPVPGTAGSGALEAGSPVGRTADPAALGGDDGLRQEDRR